MFLLAPILVVFYRPFWKKLYQHSTGYGAFYLLYITAVITLVASIFLFVIAPKYVYPQLPALWKVLPEHAKWTPSGLEVNKNKPFLLQFQGETFGAIDTSISDREPPDLKDYIVYITRTHLYVRDQDDGRYDNTSILPDEKGKEQGDVVSVEVWMNDIGDSLPEVKVEAFKASKKLAEKYELSPVDIAKWVDILWKAIVIFICTFGSFAFYCWKFMAAMVYSLGGLIINSGLGLKASYGRILNAAIFATTPAIYLQIAGVLMPKFSWLGSFWLSAAVTLAYVALILSSWRGLCLAESKH